MAETTIGEELACAAVETLPKLGFAASHSRMKRLRRHPLRQEAMRASPTNNRTARRRSVGRSNGSGNVIVPHVDGPREEEQRKESARIVVVAAEKVNVEPAVAYCDLPMPLRRLGFGTKLQRRRVIALFLEKNREMAEAGRQKTCCGSRRLLPRGTRRTAVTLRPLRRTPRREPTSTLHQREAADVSVQQVVRAAALLVAEGGDGGSGSVPSLKRETVCCAK